MTLQMSELRFCVRSDKRESFFLSLCEGGRLEGWKREGREVKRGGTILYGARLLTTEMRDSSPQIQK